jgi:hypothetical protein
MAALGLGVVTLWALEGAEVVVLRTRSAPEAPRETRIWIADAEGASWIEAASAARPFFAEIQADPRVALHRHGRWIRCDGSIEPDPAGHRRIRRLLRAKYGWRDWWIGQLADPSASRAIRLECQRP